MIIPREFYKRDTLTVARDLLGMVICRRTDEGYTSGIITECEAYMGEADPAAHSYKGKRDRVRIQYGAKGHAYVYLIYGMHHCFNITTGGEGVPESVLIRAIMPLDGIPLMEQRRGMKNGKRNISKADGREIDTSKRKRSAVPRLSALADGPGKLCKALNITMDHYGCDLTDPESGLWLEYGEPPEKIITTPRIGVDYAGEAALWPWRFVVE